MRCERCGAEILDNVEVCPYCEGKVERKHNIVPVIQQEEMQSMQHEQSINELNGKKYELISSRYMNWRGVLDSRVKSTVEVVDDRLQINIKPKRMNVSPVIMLEDILAIELSKKVCPLFVAYAILAVIAGFYSPFFFLLAVLFLVVGCNTKITITQRNGIKVVMYSKDKGIAEKFKEEMKKITKIV